MRTRHYFTLYLHCLLYCTIKQSVVYNYHRALEGKLGTGPYFVILRGYPPLFNIRRIILMSHRGLNLYCVDFQGI